MTTSRKNTWETYTKSWSETDPNKRMQLLKESLSPQCVYTDPNVQASGYENLSGYMTQFQKSAPGARFVTTEFVEHHDRSLVHWNMTDDKGKILGTGASFAVYGDDGRLLQMSGFFAAPGSR